MENNDSFDFIGQDIFSSSESQVFEDIVSDSSLTGKHYKKKTRNKFVKWWRNRKKWQKAAMISATSVFTVFALVIGIFMSVFNYNYNSITKNPDELGFQSVINKKVVNVALFGIDSRKLDSFKGLSDSIMILSLNTETKKVKIVSVMRDTLVPITYNGNTTYNKINSAYNKGGPELAIKTLNTIFGLDISEYATVNFYGMADIIDAVGGIDATLVKGELNVYGYEYGKKVNWGLNGLIAEQCGYMGLDPEKYYINSPGKHHLNGVQAVAYARIRHAANVNGVNDDFGRTDRQRYVMEQLFNKATNLKKSQYMPLVKSLIPCSETSLSYTEIMSLAINILLDSPKFEQARVPMDEYRMGSKSIPRVGSCIYFDLEYAEKVIHAFFYDDIKPEDYIAANGVEKNDWYGNRYSSTTTTSKPTTSSSSSKDNISSNISEDTSSETDVSDDTGSNDSLETSSDDTTSETESSENSSSEGTSSDSGADESSSEEGVSSSTSAESSSEVSTVTRNRGKK